MIPTKKFGRDNRYMTSIGAALAAYETAHNLYTKAKTRTEFTIAVPQHDEVYRAVQKKLYELFPRYRWVVAVSQRRYSYTGDDYDFAVPGGRGRVAKRDMFYMMDKKNSQTTHIGGHRVKIQVESPENPDGDGAPSRRYDRIIFTTHSEAAQAAVKEFITQCSDEYFADETRPHFYMPNSYGDFDEYPHLGERQLETVVLTEDKKERLIADLDMFLADEPNYVRLGLPWHRAYLFHGPPGTGKTSLACAIANEFKMDVYYLPLGDLKSDTDLMKLVSRIEPRSLLILEDIDIFHAATDRDDDRGGASLSGLLNALDGVSTPHGLITVITTNDMSMLDPALVRPGRVDLIEELGYVGDREVAQLYEMFYGGPVPALPHIGEIAPAAIVEVFKRHMSDPQRGLEALEAHIKDSKDTETM